MKFGKLENIDNVDFKLPADHEISNEFLNNSPVSTARAIVYTGATSWNNLNWKGVIYDEKIKKNGLLGSYSKHFNSIELNATHYRTPSDNSINTWKNETPEDFRFCPKILQAISHRRDMTTNSDLVNNFILQIAKLEEKLGQTFIQLPPYFKHANLEYLEKFLSVWPIELSLAVELRDIGIHQSPEHLGEYLRLLRSFNATPLITDVSGRRDLLHMAVISEDVFVRWVGNGLVTSDYSRIDQWVIRLEEWAMKGVKRIYFMLHEPENETTPEIAAYLKDKLKNNQYIVHRGPELIQEPPNLFT